MKPAAASKEVMSLREIIKSRCSEDAAFELRVPHFNVHQGEFVALTGASGCGKSTLLDMLSLMSRPDKGDCFQMLVSGQMTDMLSLPRRKLAQIRCRDIGYVLQTGGLIDFLSVAGNIGLPARLNRLSDIRKRVQELARALGIEDQLSKFPAALSGGQRQRVAVARAVVHQPGIVLADEPTAALDQPRATALLSLLHALCKQRGISIVVVTHDVDLIRDFADRVYAFSVEKKQGRAGTVSICAELQSFDRMSPLIS